MKRIFGLFIILATLIPSSVFAATFTYTGGENLERMEITPGKTYEISFEFDHNAENILPLVEIFPYDLSLDYEIIDPDKVSKTTPMGWVRGSNHRIENFPGNSKELFTYFVDIPEELGEGTYEISFVARDLTGSKRVPLIMLYGDSVPEAKFEVVSINPLEKESIVAVLRNVGNAAGLVSLKYDLKDKDTWAIRGTGIVRTPDKIPPGREVEIRFYPQVDGVPTGDYLITTYVDDYGQDIEFSYISPEGLYTDEEGNLLDARGKVVGESKDESSPEYFKNDKGEIVNNVGEVVEEVPPILFTEQGSEFSRTFSDAVDSKNVLEDKESQRVSTRSYLVIALIAVVLIVGGVLLYFLWKRKRS